MQPQHQTDPLICTRGKGTGSLAWIKERRGFAHGLAWARTRFLSPSSFPARWSRRNTAFSSILPRLFPTAAPGSSAASLTLALASRGLLGLLSRAEVIANTSSQEILSSPKPIDHYQAMAVPPDASSTRQPREGRDIHEWSPPFTAGCPGHPDTAPTSPTSQGPVVADAESCPCGDWLAIQCRFNWIWQRCQLCIGGKQVLDFVICPVW